MDYKIVDETGSRKIWLNNFFQSKERDHPNRYLFDEILIAYALALWKHMPANITKQKDKIAFLNAFLLQFDSDTSMKDAFFELVASTLKDEDIKKIQLCRDVIADELVLTNISLLASKRSDMLILQNIIEKVIRIDKHITI